MDCNKRSPVEEEVFRNLIYILRKDAFIPSADTIKNDIMKVFDDCQKRIRNILQVIYIFILYINIFFFEFLLINI